MSDWSCCKDDVCNKCGKKIWECDPDPKVCGRHFAEPPPNPSLGAQAHRGE